MTPPTIAVLVASHQRPRLLARCLEALCNQARPADQVVVVVSGEESEAVVRQFAGRLPLVHVPHGPGGQAEARNDGLAMVTAELVAITDDDCRPAPGWLASFEAAWSPGLVLSGRTEPDPDDGGMQAVTDRTMKTGPEDAARFSTCNILYPTEVLRAVGGFDSSFAFYAEDTDLGMRAVGVGARGGYVDGALVHHVVHRSAMRPAMRERWRYTWMVRLVRVHPRLRRELFHGWFWAPYHRLLLLAYLALPGLLLSPLALLLLAPWTRSAFDRMHAMYADNYWQRSRVGDLGRLFLLDSVEVAACALGSIRERTLFL